MTTARRPRSDSWSSSYDDGKHSHEVQAHLHFLNSLFGFDYSSRQKIAFNLGRLSLYADTDFVNGQFVLRRGIAAHNRLHSVTLSAATSNCGTGYRPDQGAPHATGQNRCAKILVDLLDHMDCYTAVEQFFAFHHIP